MTDMPDWDDDILGEDTTDDVIELNDIVPDSSDEPDDGMIELTDIVVNDPGAAPEEPVIELDEPVIELTEIVDDDTALDSDLVLDDMDGDDLDFGDDLSMEDEFAETSEVEPEIESDETQIESEIIGLPDDDFDVDLDQEALADEASIDALSVEEDPSDAALADEMPMQEAAVDEVPVVGAPGAEINVGMDDIEAALDRVIEKKFAGRIEAMLFETMEKVIEKEIKLLKSSLLKDLDQNEND